MIKGGNDGGVTCTELPKGVVALELDCWRRHQLFVFKKRENGDEIYTNIL